MNTIEMREAFASAEHVLPVEALQWCRDNWDEAGPALLETLNAYADGSERTKRAEDILFFAVYLFAEKGETRAFAPFCLIARDRETVRLSAASGDLHALRGVQQFGRCIEVAGVLECGEQRESHDKRYV